MYTVEDNADFEYLPMRITDKQMKMTDVLLNCDMIEAKLAKLKTDKLHMLDRWTEYLECGGQIDVVYTDFEKAFDKVPQS